MEGIGTHLQDLYDEVVLGSEDEPWSQALRLVVDTAAPVVPYKDDEDAWYGPNVAVWSAAWAFALEELYLARCLPIPPELSAQLYWYERGHWPCALVMDSQFENTQDYIVY